MDINKIQELVDLINNNDINELEIGEGDTYIRITGNKYPPHSEPRFETLSETISHAAHTSQPAENKPAHDGHAVKAPMVGSVYLAPTPGAKPFVEIGQRVQVGDTLCLIEAMKMFNKVEADKAGVISACLIENSHSVEYDQTLFIIEEA